MAGYAGHVRIVHVSDCFAPRLGGIENQVQDLSVHQAQAGHAVHVLTATATDPATAPPGASRYRHSSTVADAVRVHRLATPATFGVPMHPRGRALITRALRLLEPDVVHVHAGMVSPLAYHGAQAARDLGLGLAITWHSVLHRVTRPMGWGARAAGWDATPFAPSAVSGLVARQVAEVFGRTDVAVVPNGVHLRPWRSAAGNPVPPSVPGVLRVVAAQRLASRKRAVPMIRMLAQAHQALGRGATGHPRIHLTVAGDGPAAGAMRRQIAAGDLDEVVTLLGRVPRQVLPTLYRSQDVFFSPTRLEAFGLSALEARAAGLAVVGRAGSGITEFIEHGTSGLLAHTDAGLVDHLVRLARDPDQVQHLTAHNRSRAPALGWADVLGQVERLYSRARDLAGQPR